ncbi:hypothetical protein GCM10018781_59290 [Kitasatospora indigofera]|uniref:Uncharacterized protein n=1 Tax=Kitasatospora indigofera TaxID=67307 RepID=A0A919L242_9ACTN|nr:hypothetical protein GCM10018781_59290 [Kitasatospora indigofera]
MRSFAEFTPAAAASSSEETVGTERSESAVNARRYSGRRATVASGIPRAREGRRAAPWSGVCELLCGDRPIATVLLWVKLGLGSQAMRL